MQRQINVLDLFVEFRFQLFNMIALFYFELRVSAGMIENLKTRDITLIPTTFSVVYQFTCASCGARYIGETDRHFNTRVNEHLFRDKNSHIFKHLSASKGCRDKCDISCFKILDHASTYSQLKIKESFHIEQLKPELNKQVEHVNLSLHF